MLMQHRELQNVLQTPIALHTFLLHSLHAPLPVRCLPVPLCFAGCNLIRKQ